MEPSEALAASLAEHRALREAAHALEAEVLGCSCRALPPGIARGIVALTERVRAHLAEEDARLAPLLAQLDAWGPLRLAHNADRRRTELRRVAEMLDRLAQPLHEGPLRAHVLRFVDWIDDELAAEEAQLVNARLLRDDPIRDDTEGG